MSTSNFSHLDQTELLQLGLNASAGGDSASALGYLKEAAGREDASAYAHFLLGAEYAQVKLYQRAIDALEAAVALDPALSIARFQLGLLWLSSGVPERALETLAPLEELGAGDPLNRFALGLRHLMGDQFSQAVFYLHEGMALNTGNAPLNADMQKIVSAIEALPNYAVEPAPASGQAHHVLLSAYTGNGQR